MGILAADYPDTLAGTKAAMRMETGLDECDSEEG